MAQTIKSLDSKFSDITADIMAQLASLSARITELESASVALPLPSAPRQGSQTPVRSVPTNKMLALLMRLGEFPDFDAAVAAGWTYEQAKNRLDAWANLFRGVPSEPKVKCVHCQVGHHSSSAEVRECWASKLGAVQFVKIGE